MSFVRSWTTALVCTVLLLVGCLIIVPGPARASTHSPSSNPTSAGAGPEESERKQQGEAVFRRFLELDWQLAASGGLAPDQDPPTAVTDLLTGAALDDSLDYYRWIYTEPLRVSGGPPKLMWLDVESPGLSVRIEACLDWSGVVMETDQVSQWRGRGRTLFVTLRSEGFTYKLSSILEYPCDL